MSSASTLLSNISCVFCGNTNIIITDEVISAPAVTTVSLQKSRSAERTFFFLNLLPSLEIVWISKI